MPETIVTRILRLPGYGVYAWDAEATTGTLTLWVRQTAREPFYVCGGCGISVRDVHSWTERRLRDLPWGTWQVWLVLEIHRVRCRRCGVRTERVAFVEGKAHATTRLAQAVAQACEAAPVSRVAAQWGLAPQTVRRLDQRVLRRWAVGRARGPRCAISGSMRSISGGATSSSPSSVTSSEASPSGSASSASARRWTGSSPRPCRRAAAAPCAPSAWTCGSPSPKASGRTCRTPGSCTTANVPRHIPCPMVSARECGVIPCDPVVPTCLTLLSPHNA
jgi:zinc-finger of transposase IS204/IS1001/IS1096/IS1165/Helix-turn-helix domain of transposase family ISL3